MSDAKNANGAQAIRAAGLVKRYQNGQITALDGLDLEVRAGEFVAVCGPSGCGKSTLLNLIAGIDRPDAGELAVFGKRAATLTEVETDALRSGVIGLVFQLHNLLPQLTAAENVQVAMMPGERTAAQRAARAEELLTRVGLAHRMNALPPTLSGGERQRVAVARALANSPKLLLADEPTGALDSKTGGQLFELLGEIQRELGMTLLVVTHDEHIAARAGRVVRILDGKVC
ncbi:MAG: ABC transporter ATP-binding protein [Planctomycetes bacterium]|nr:ABC transporter ATP-binding protein [Planctomycetota bacterium]